MLPSDIIICYFQIISCSRCTVLRVMNWMRTLMSLSASVTFYIYRANVISEICWFSESQFTNELTKNTFAALHYKHQLRTKSQFYYLWDYNAQHVQKNECSM